VLTAVTKQITEPEYKTNEQQKFL